ncbi:MAG: hypothetical protein Q9191_002081 [Dirinaria sp. TL-2023a]
MPTTVTVTTTTTSLSTTTATVQTTESEYFTTTQGVTREPTTTYFPPQSNASSSRLHLHALQIFFFKLLLKLAQPANEYIKLDISNLEFHIFFELLLKPAYKYIKLDIINKHELHVRSASCVSTSLGDSTYMFWQLYLFKLFLKPANEYTKFDIFANHELQLANKYTDDVVDKILKVRTILEQPAGGGRPEAKYMIRDY